MNKTFLHKGLQVAALSATVLAAYPSQAAIISSSIQGGVLKQPQTALELDIIDPPPQKISVIGFEERQSDGKIKYFLNPDPNRDLLGIVEKQSVVLSKDLKVLSAFDDTNTKLNLTLAKDTLVSSYLFYFNPPGSAAKGGAEYMYNWVGQIVFDTPVLGIIGGFSAPFLPSNNLVGLDNTEYDVRTALDPGQDFVTFSGNVLTFNVTAKTGRDPFRVITDGTPVVQAVPEPLTILGSFSAIGFGTWFRKVRSKGDNKSKQSK